MRRCRSPCSIACPHRFERLAFHQVLRNPFPLEVTVASTLLRYFGPRNANTQRSFDQRTLAHLVVATTAVPALRGDC